MAITVGPQTIAYTSFHQPASLSETIDGTSYLLGACPERSRGAVPSEVGAISAPGLAAFSAGKAER